MSDEWIEKFKNFPTKKDTKEIKGNFIFYRFPNKLQDFLLHKNAFIVKRAKNYILVKFDNEEWDCENISNVNCFDGHRMNKIFLDVSINDETAEKIYYYCSPLCSFIELF